MGTRLPLLALLLALAAPPPGSAAPDALFDGGAGLPGAGLALPGAFKPTPRPSLPGGRLQAPTVSFQGLDLKTFLFSDQDRIADSLTAAIGRTQQTLWAALYELNLPEAADALIAAKNRGVDMRVVFDYGHAFPAGGKPRSPDLDRLLAAGIEVRVLRGTGQYGIMHNKFALFDGQLLETGSFNWTTAANTANFENAIFRTDASLLSGFTAFWQWMWDQAKPLSLALQLTDAQGAPPADAGQALSYKGQAWPAYVFSPNGGAEGRVVSAVRLAQSRVDIAMFSFYSQKIADALLDAKNRGVAVRIVADRSQASHSPLTAFFKQNGFDFKLLSGISGPGVLHDKFGLYDGELLETGSFNYTLNADLNNFENSVYSTAPEDLAGYQAEFEGLYGQGQAP